MGKIVEVKTEAELAEALKTATGPVVLDFVDMEGCSYCQEESPRIEKLVASCRNVTVIRAYVTNPEIDKLANDWKVDALPTLYVASTPSELRPGVAREVENARAAMAFLKCKR